MSPTQAAEDPLSPTARVEAAWIVAKGAAVEVRYSVTCPVNPLAGNGLMAMVVTLEQGSATLGTDYLEFTCTGSPETITVTNLIGTVGADSGRLEVTTRLFNCLFAGPGGEGCFTPEFTESVRAKPGLLRPENTEDRGLAVETVDVRSTSTGEARITQVLSCPVHSVVSLQTTLTQVKGGLARTGFMFYVEPGSVFADFECEGTETVTYVLPATTGPGFATGDAVIESMLAACFELCDQAFDTAVVNVRR